MKSNEQMRVLANDLRRTISDLLGVRHAERIVLTPGILIALRMFFSHLGVKRILLTSEEYYGADHFPGATVQVAPCDAIPGLLREQEFDALVASPASWRGVRQPVEELFARIRKASGKKAPLLVADHSHAGSIGFPSVERLAADIVCGDLEKWILPPGWSSGVAFLSFQAERLFTRVANVFCPFFLATQSSNVSTLARWVDPEDVLAVSTKLADLGVTAAQLRERHQADMELARKLALQLQLTQMPETSILWLDGGEPAGETIAYLEKLGLVWRLPGRGTRVLCRNDLMAGSA